MKQIKTANRATAHHPHMTMERRGISRAPVSFGLMYSGITEDNVLMGDGTVVDLSKGGLGIRGNHPVPLGMELTLFLYVPDSEDPLFVLEAIVAWENGRQFGVEFKKLSLREKNRLHSFLRAQFARHV